MGTTGGQQLFFFTTDFFVDNFSFLFVRESNWEGGNYPQGKFIRAYRKEIVLEFRLRCKSKTYIKLQKSTMSIKYLNKKNTRNFTLEITFETVENDWCIIVKIERVDTFG